MTVDVAQSSAGEPPLTVTVTDLVAAVPAQGTVTGLVQRSIDGGIRWITVRGLAEAPIDAGGDLPVTKDWEYKPGVTNQYRAGVNQIFDTFTRSASGSFGACDTGQSWVNTGSGTVGVSGSAATVALTSNASGHLAVLDVDNIADADVSMSFDLSSIDAQADFHIIARSVDASNEYLVRFRIEQDETVRLYVVTTIGGVTTEVESTILPIAHAASQVYRMRTLIRGHRIRAKAWVAVTVPQPDWQLDVVIPPAQRIGGGAIGWQVARHVFAGSTLTFTVDDYVADIGQPQWIGGTDSITPTLTQPWLCSVMRSFLNRSITIRSYEEPSRAARGGHTEVHGRTLPIGQVELSGSREWQLELRAQDLDEARALEFLVASGDVLWLLVPSGSPVPGGYYRVGQLESRHHRQQGLTRWLTLPLTEMAAPGPDVITAQSTVDTVLGVYGTVEDLLAAVPTVEDLLELIGDPAEVIVDQ